jgi:hypothetical protein
MWDFIKLRSYLTKSEVNFLIHESELKFIKTSCPYTNDVISHTCHHGPMKFTIYPSGCLNTAGSLHKFYNYLTHNQSRNDDLYSYTKFITTLEFFQNVLNLDISELRIHNIEFATNIELPCAVDEYLKHILAYKWLDFDMIRSETKWGLTKTTYEYWVKLYFKGFQFGDNANLLRIEKSIKTMRCIFKEKHLYLSDLINKSYWEHCGNDLLKMLDNILISDTFSGHLLSKPKMRIIMECSDKTQWKNFTKQKRSINMRNYGKIVDVFGQLKIKSNLKKLIKEQLDQITNN